MAKAWLEDKATWLAYLRRALEAQIEAPPRSEMRTLDEVQGIVDVVRAA